MMDNRPYLANNYIINNIVIYLFIVVYENNCPKYLGKNLGDDGMGGEN